MTGRGAPAAKAKPSSTEMMGTIGQPFKFDLPPDTSGMAKPKIRKPSTISTAASVRPIIPTSAPALCLLLQPGTSQPLVRPILPKPAPAMCLLPQPGNAQPLVMATQPPVLPQTMPAKPVKRKLPSQEPPVVPRKQPTCRKCNEPRLPPLHKQYMGFWWCEKKSEQPFEEWRAELVSRGVARRKNKLL